MRRFWACLTVFGLCCIAAGPARADFLIYRISPEGSSGRRSADDDDRRGRRRAALARAPGGAASAELRIILQGRVQQNPGSTVTYFHPTIKEPLYFNRADVEVKKAATPQHEYGKRLAAAGKDPDAVMKAAIWALKKGLLKEFYSAVDKALLLDAGHEAARRIQSLKTQMDQPLPDTRNAALEQELRGYVRLPEMRIATSRHFIMLHDLPTKAAPGKKKSRVQARLDLLEEVYESFLLLFHAQDIELDIPRERMKVVLFREHRDYEGFSTSLSPTLISAAGFWEPVRNVSVFYDHSTGKTFLALEKIQGELKKLSDEARRNRNNPDLIRRVKLMDMLIDIDRENADITVVSHEGTHQMAGNTGLLPRHVEIPRWVHEGLATYFEAPGDAAWAGIGAVNEDRLAYYRALEKDRVHSNIDFIAANQIFDYARTHGAEVHGYGQAWALTHFLLENHLQEFVAYYRMLGDMPPDVALNPRLLVDLFNSVFGSDHQALDREWRQYMRSLKTDFERLEQSTSGGKGRS
jgi:hypothetical protein